MIPWLFLRRPSEASVESREAKKGGSRVKEWVGWRCEGAWGSPTDFGCSVVIVAWQDGQNTGGYFALFDCQRCLVRLA